MKNVYIDIYNNKDKILPPLRKIDKQIIAELELENTFEIESGDFKGPYLKKISHYRKRGRPVGRKNKKKTLYNLSDPLSNGNELQQTSADISQHGHTSTTDLIRKRGRPKGSKNKPK
jgi:hypothetical protein